MNDLCAMEKSSSNIENESTPENESRVLSERGVPKIVFKNEKGNVRVKERKVLRDGILDQINSVFIAHPYGKQKNVNGGFSILLGTDATTGENIWAHIELTVNNREPNIDRYSGREVTMIRYEIPDLF